LKVTGFDLRLCFEHKFDQFISVYTFAVILGQWNYGMFINNHNKKVEDFYSN